MVSPNLMMFVLLTRDADHGKVEDDFAEFFRDKAHGINYQLIYNRYAPNNVNMSFLNQQYSKMRIGQEILSENHATKVHENNTQHSAQFQDDILHLRSMIKSVTHTVHNNRKKKMKANLIMHRDKMKGITSLRRLKICDRLINNDLNLYDKPRAYRWHWLGLEL